MRYHNSNVNVGTTPPVLVSVRSLSGTEARVILALEARRQDEVTLDEIEALAHVRRGFARKLAHGLVVKSWLRRVGRGRYLRTPTSYGPDAGPEADPLRIGRHLVRPYYFAYGTAAELWGLSLHPGRTYYLVTPSRTRASVSGAARFHMVRTDPARFFGFADLRRRGETLIVSDRERTVLDCLRRPEYAGGFAGAAQILARAKAKLAWGRLAAYAARLGGRSLQRRLGYLAETLRPSVAPPPAVLARLRPRPADAWVPLGPPRMYGRSGPRDQRWRLLLNVPERELFAEADTQ